VNRPSLSVVVPARHGRSLLNGLRPLAEQVEAVGGEIVVVDGSGEHVRTSLPVRWIAVCDTNLLRLRSVAVRAARGAIVAIGEDHAVPRPGWCEAILRAHSEHPNAAAVAGCLVNATDRTVAGRANFIGFAAQYSPPMPSLPRQQPPPASTVSFKREVLDELGDSTGRLESDLIPRLFREGRIAADDRVLVEHHQDKGILWSAQNAFASARAGYGYGRLRQEAHRRDVVRWVLTRMPSVLWQDARDGRAKTRYRRRDLPAIALIQASAVAGATLGTLKGPGRAPDRVA
jgi:hypothetical protein